MTVRRRVISLLVALVCGLLDPAVAPAQSSEIRLTIANQAPFAFIVSGPTNDLYVAEWSSNLFTWVAFTTNAFLSPPLFPQGHLLVPDPLPPFFRARRFEPPEICGSPGCFIETNGVTCPAYGPPDNPTNRNNAIPNGGTPVKSIRLLIHALANSDGSDPATDDTKVREQMETLNRHFRPHRIQFVWTFETNRSSQFRRLFSRQQGEQMMSVFAVDPALQHNVFVTETPPNLYGFSIYPWLTNASGTLLALGPEGSTVVSLFRFGNDEVTLTHELGHALGLWHTHHGSEVGPGCNACSEISYGSQADTTGDRCSDTPPTLLDGNGLPFGRDCQSNAWPALDANNFMSSTPWQRGRFTPQQAGRMHAWIDYGLSGWLDTNTPAAPSDFRVEANDFGEVELYWTDNSWNETGFRIERSLDDLNFIVLTNLPANTASFFDDTSLPGQVNTYRLVAINGNAPNVEAVSYVAHPARSAVPTRISDIVYVDITSSNSPPNGLELYPFRTLGDALTDTPDGTRRIFRVRSGEYNEPLIISNKAVRVESRGGSILIGNRATDGP